jgi:hypothetical protein
MLLPTNHEFRKITMDIDELVAEKKLKKTPDIHLFQICYSIYPLVITELNTHLECDFFMVEREQKKPIVQNILFWPRANGL